ncbi:hypothetical protein DPMN_150637 [Dreissena polymorpha]|uniref:Uncharacterized protein n=1 Tax=Dreissena polymorpha TaxID=45954 RepID=A0A9D4J6I4_DREPO|nr:hypothetical protein DPMN_150637 [Dreissena polymorpha]
MRDSMKATNALLKRLVLAQEISHARQPFITYMSQSLQQLPEAQYQLTVERMTAILYDMQRSPTPSLQLNHLQHQYLHLHSPSTSSGRIATSPRLSITASSSSLSLSLSTSLSTSSNCRHPEAASQSPPQGAPAQDSCCQTCRSFTPLTKPT